jgi:hypothetical protein
VAGVNLPEVVAEVRAVFERYEAALVANDIATLDELFWDSAETVRYGFSDVQHGFAEVAAFRRSLPRQTAPRTLVRTSITTFGSDAAAVTTEFVLDGDQRMGRQSQLWIRTVGGWRVASAHVSWPTV